MLVLRRPVESARLCSSYTPPIAAQSHLFVGLANPDTRWIVLAGGDHAAMLEDTQPAFIAGIDAFVSRPGLSRRRSTET